MFWQVIEHYYFKIWYTDLQFGIGIVLRLLDRICSVYDDDDDDSGLRVHQPLWLYGAHAPFMDTFQILDLAALKTSESKI